MTQRRISQQWVTVIFVSSFCFFLTWCIKHYKRVTNACYIRMVIIGSLPIWLQFRIYSYFKTNFDSLKDGVAFLFWRLPRAVHSLPNHWLLSFAHWATTEDFCFNKKKQWKEFEDNLKPSSNCEIIVVVRVIALPLKSTKQSSPCMKFRFWFCVIY